MTWRFHIRQGVKFQNGDPMTPELVKASIERSMNENERAKKIARIKEMRVEGEDLVFVTTTPYASFVSSLSDPVFIIVNTQSDLSKVASTPVLTGPYAITGWAKGVEIQLKRNEHYWDGTPGLETVTVKNVEDDVSRAMAIQSGEFDLIQRLSAANRSLFENNANYGIYETTGVRVQMLTTNEEGVLGDKNLRTALAYLFDSEALAEVYGNAVAAGEPFPPSIPYGHPGEKITHDPAKADAAFAAAGYTKNAQGMYEKNGQPLTLKFAWLRGMFYSDSTSNRGHYKSAAFDAILDEMATAMDPARKDELVKAAARQLIEDQPTLFLTVPMTILAGKSNVKNVKIFPLDYYLLTKDVTVE